MFLYLTYIISLIFLLLSFLSFIFSFLVYNLGVIFFSEWLVFNLFSVDVIMMLMFDWMSFSFCGVVMLISSLVMIYISFYMNLDSSLIKFVLLVFLFVLSMILLIFSPNMISILLGWDGLGLVSYCLVIYYENVKSSNAGLLTIFSNRFGDILILLSISLILSLGTTSMFYLESFILDNNIKFIFYLLLFAATTKSAQIPFSAWLPAAMAAPTPVSSLVHSSTLVTAGVYLLIRFYNIFDVKYILFIISLFTMLMSGIGAIYENDLKKIIALSTLSQLGLMMMTLSFGLIEMSFFHLMSHALFKSLLFLCAGAFIHSLLDWQDSRVMSFLWFISPIISLFFIISSLSLCGFPFMSGFYSKDLIVEFFFMSNLNFFIVFLTLISLVGTFLYTIRLYSFINIFHGNLIYSFSSSDSFGMFIPISLLFFLSFLGGSFMIWFYFPLNFIYLNSLFKLMILFLGFLSVFSFCLMGYWFYIKSKYYGFILILSLMWNLINLSTFFLTNLLSISFNYIKYLDQGWGDYFGSQGLYMVVTKYSFFLDTFNLLSYKNFFFVFLFIYLLFFFIY